MPATPLGVLGLGFALGLRHALDADHLAAVSTIVTARRTLWSSWLVGALWGLGHTAALLAAAVLVIGLHTEIPPTVAALCELGVAAMLVGLGASLLATLARGGRVHTHAHAHAHAGRRHGHPHVHASGTDVHDHGPSARRPFLVGLVHGLAGSGALMLAVLATIPGPALAFCYVAVFGLGSVGGMIVMSTLFAVPALVTTGRVARADVALRAVAAAGSIAIGLHLAWEIGMQVGLLA